MKSLVLFPVAVLCVTTAFAQSHLDPDAPQYDFETVYQNNLQTVFSSAYSDDVIVRMMGEPSFFPEYVVGLRKTESGTAIFGLRTKIQIWSFQSRDQLKRDALSCDSEDCLQYRKYVDAMPDDIHDIGVDRCEVPLSDELAAEIEEAWRLSLARVGKNGDTRTGVDGEFYYFAMNDGGRHLGGKVWTPDANTLPGKLVSLALDMSNLCEGKGDVSIAKIGTEASALVRELRKAK